ncbi:MAG: LysM peptidoglycan-binding domain-containing protein [Kofleriaceae bacterium]
MKSLVIVVVIVGLLVARIAAADDADFVQYKVKPGDTIDLVAAEFYGDHVRTSVFIVDENKWKTYRKLNPGERIRVPITREITTAKGDTLPELATKYLGDASRATYIAQLNHLEVTDIPAAGVALRLPFRVTHVAQTTESLAAIAQFYFGDAKQAELLRAYNNLGDKAALEKNDSIVVPVMSLRVHTERLPAPSAEALARRKQHANANEAAATALPAARLAQLQGDYAEVAKALAEIAKQLEYLDEPAFGEAGMLLGTARVAAGDKAGATAVFGEVVAREPARTLSPYYASPTVIEAWSAAGGRVVE